MSGFQFPPPPPPPPTESRSYETHSASQDLRGGFGGRGRGRGRPQNSDSSRGYRHPHGQPNGDRTFRHQSASNYATRPSQADGYNTNSNLFSSDQVRATNFRGGYAPNGPNRGNRNSSHDFRESRSMQADTAVSPQRTTAGHKRKLDVLRGPSRILQDNPPPSIPSTPSFGGPILPTKDSTVLEPSQMTSLASQRKITSIGLIPTNENIASSSDTDDADDDGDVDEESMYAALGSKLTFEHNGTVVTLESTADLLNWKEERKTNFPTQARFERRMEMKRQVGAERKRLIREAREKLYGVPQAGSHQRAKFPSPNTTTNTVGPNIQQPGDVVSSLESRPHSHDASELEAAKEKLALQQEKVESLRLQIASDQARRGILTPRYGEKTEEEHHQLGRSAETSSSTHAGQHSTATEPNSSTTEQDGAGDVPQDLPVLQPAEDADDEPPEELSAKTSADQHSAPPQPCKYFSTTGRCRDGSNCPYPHDMTLARTAAEQRRERQSQQRGQQPNATRESTWTGQDRKGIHQRLVEQQQAEENRLVVQLIKQLGQAGFFA